MALLFLSVIALGILFQKFLAWRENQGVKEAGEYVRNNQLHHREIQPWELYRRR